MKEVKYYEAMDGTRFDTYKECEDYEMNASGDMTIDVTVYYRQVRDIPYKLTLPKTVVSGWDDFSMNDRLKIEEELSKCYGDGELLAIEIVNNHDILYEGGY